MNKYNIDWYLAAFNYDTIIDYANDILLNIRQMTHVYKHCKAEKYKDETPGMCCRNCKVDIY